MGDKMNLSKSKYCSGITCFKKLWLEINKPDVKEVIGNETTLENGTEVGFVAKDLFDKYIDVEYSDNLYKMIEDTKRIINENIYCNICEASFSYNNNFCSIDILKKDKDNYEIYEVKSSLSILYIN